MVKVLMYFVIASLLWQCLKLEGLDFVCKYNKYTLTLDIHQGYEEEKVRECLQNHSTAETLQFRQSKLKTIPWYVGILDHLVNLDLSQNEIISIAFNTSALAKTCRNLKNLIMDFNNIQILHPGSLDCLESLERLSLANNNLTVIKNGTFSEKLKAITYIHLFNNSLTEIDSSLFSKLRLSSNLTLRVNASWNKLKSISNSVNITIENCSNLTKIYLIVLHNNITTVDLDYYAKMFNVTYALQFMNLGNSGIDARFNPFICDCSLYPLALFLRIFYTMDSDNPVFSVTCGSPASLNGKMIRKVLLNQFNCSVTMNCPDTCKCTKTVAHDLITVGCNDAYPVHELPGKCPSASNVSLIIRSSNLTRISPGGCLINVTLLDVSQSSVTDVDPLIVDMMESRDNRQIYLHDNALERIPRRFEKFNFSTGQILTLHGNPFNCDCNLLWMKQWLLLNTEYVPYQDKIKCQSGLGKGKPVTEVANNKFVCMSSPSFKDILTMTVGSLCVVLLFSLVVYKRNNFQVFLIHHFDIFKYLLRKKAYRNLKFDIFIPHSCEDDEIVKKLVKTLESMSQPYKVCLGERDFVVGKTVSENILTAIESSQTTLLTISNNFLRSTWCNMEFREAHMRFLKDRNIKMVLVLLEELDTSLVYEELKLYMDSHVYIRYSDKYFWAKLLKSLPVMISNDSIGETSALLSEQSK
nr:Ls-TLR2 [Cyclina sinensis]